MRPQAGVAWCWLALAVAGSASAAAPFALEDQFKVERVIDAAISPDGAQVAVVTERRTDASYWDRIHTLWLVPAGGGAPQRLAGDTAESQNRPLWSADGRRLIYAARQGTDETLRLHDLAKRTTTTLRVCAEGEKIATLAWSPDNHHVAVICEPDVLPFVAGHHQGDGGPSEQTVLLASTAAFYGAGPPAPRNTRRVVLHDLDAGRSREIAQQASFLAADGDLQWSSAQTLWMFATPEDPNAGMDWVYGRIPHRFDLAGSRVSVLPEIPDLERTPLVMANGEGFLVPSGGRIGGARDDWRRTWRLDPFTVRAVDTQGHTRSTSNALDIYLQREGNRTLRSPAPDGSGDDVVYFQWLDRASGRVKSYRPARDEWRDITPEHRNVDAYSVSADGRTMAVVQGDADTPAEVYLVDLRDPAAEPRRVTRFGDAVRSLYAVSSVERLSWRSADDRFDVDGWLLKPAGYQPGKRYPMILDVHGGPGVAFRNRFDTFRFEGAHQVPPELYAARGYLVLMVNPRGDPGYGRDYLEALLEGWEYPTRYDLFSGVDEMVRRGYADPDRLGIAGASYGGWVTAFAVSQTDRFKAASANDPVIDTAVSSAVAYRGPLLGNYWLHAGFAGGHLRDVPFISVDPRPVKTPILLRFGLKESPPFPSMFFVSGLEYFTYLHTHCRPVEMIMHPKEGHGVVDGKTLRDYIGRDLAWFDYWLLGRGDRPMPARSCQEG